MEYKCHILDSGSDKRIKCPYIQCLVWQFPIENYASVYFFVNKYICILCVCYKHNTFPQLLRDTLFMGPKWNGCLEVMRKEADSLTKPTNRFHFERMSSANSLFRFNSTDTRNNFNTWKACRIYSVK